MTHLTDGAIRRLQSALETPDLSGTKYQLLERVARGGMGTVYLALDSDLHRRVALKVLTLPDDSGRMVARMREEARVVASLEHPSIIPIHDVGLLPDGRVYYAMKYVQGETLTDWLAHRPAMNSKIRLIQQVCDAMAFAHSRGIIHRDLKPDNIMVGSFGEVLVMDWGVAKEMRPNKGARYAGSSAPAGGAADMDATADGPTSQGSVIGTPAFMSPEQAAGDADSVDARSDVYAIGATLFYALTGRPPLDSRSASEMHRDRQAGKAPDPRRFESTVPRPLAAICLKALAKEPRLRYQGADELSADIGRFLNQEQVAAYPENLIQKSGRWMRKNQFLVMLLLAYIVLRALAFFLLKR